MARSWLWAFHSVQPLLLHRPVHFLVYPHDWVPNKIILFYFISAEYFPNTSKTKGWSMCCCSIACRHDKESTQITYLFLLELFTTSRASCIACSSAVYMDVCPGKRLLIILKFETAHPNLWSFFEPSVYRNFIFILDVVEKSLEYQWIGVDSLYCLQTIYNYWGF